jgi:hypothetical protein
VTTFQIIWKDAAGANHLDEVYAYDRHLAIAAGFKKHQEARGITVL